MSANNWTDCPKCREASRIAKDLALQLATEAHGKVPVGECEKMLTDTVAMGFVSNSLREDYSLGLSREGKFEVRYRAYCATCGFEYTFHEEEWPEENEYGNA